MIDRERFEQLAALTVAGEASAAERADLEAALASEPALVDELLELSATDLALRRAVEAPTVSAEPLPRPAFERLDRVRREALNSRLADAATAAGAETVVPFRSPERKKRFVPTLLALAACLAVLISMAPFYLPARFNSSKSIAVLAPREATGFTQPTLVWDARPGQRYDVWIIPAEGNQDDVPALFVAKGVLPPVAFTNLKPGPALKDQPSPRALTADQDYRLLVCLADVGRIAGTAYPFHVSTAAISNPPHPTLAEAQKLAADGRLSDALMLFVQLPSAERERPEAQNFEKDLRSRVSRMHQSATPAP